MGVGVSIPIAVSAVRVAGDKANSENEAKRENSFHRARQEWRRSLSKEGYAVRGVLTSMMATARIHRKKRFRDDFVPGQH
jgi:hypothetical protein